ncbi:MAG: hypothetical protein Tsb0021_02090 [Chlamydiales bacterium]
MNPIQFVSEAAKKSHLHSFVPPKQALMGLLVMHKIHTLVCLHQSYRNIFQDQDRVMQYFAGTVTQKLADGTPFKLPLQVIAKIALVGVVLIKCMESFDEFSQKYQALCRSLSCRDIISVDTLSTNPNLLDKTLQIFDPVIAQELKIRCKILILRISVVVSLVFELFVAALKLSSCLIQLAKAHEFVGVLATHNDNAVFVHLKILFDQIGSDTKKLEENLKENSKPIDEYLKAMGTSFRTRDLLRWTRETHDLTQVGGQVVQTAGRIVQSSLMGTWKIFTGNPSSQYVPPALPQKKIDYRSLKIPFTERPLYNLTLGEIERLYVLT